MIKALVILLYIAVTIYGADKVIKARRAAGLDLLDFPRANEYIENLNKKRLRLNSIEQLLTDIEAHAPGAGEQPLIIRWYNSIGEQQETHIYINESPAVNEALRELIQAERKTLRCSLSSDLLRVPLRHNGNETETRGAFARIFKRGRAER